MGSGSDYEVMKEAEVVLRSFEVPHEVKIRSAHRTPDLLREYAQTARDRGIRVIIAAAGGAAHIAGMAAAWATVPVLGVPIVQPTTAHQHFGGLDALASMIQMPRGVPIACLAVNGAANAAYFAVLMLGMPEVHGGYDYFERWQKQREALASCAPDEPYRSEISTPDGDVSTPETTI